MRAVEAADEGPNDARRGVDFLGYEGGARSLFRLRYVVSSNGGFERRELVSGEA